MIDIKQKGDFFNLTNFLKNAKEAIQVKDLDHYGKEGVKALELATPKKTGTTSVSWSYEIVKSKDDIRISFHNSNVRDGVPIAIILQTGHGTRNGGWVEGRDYINPALLPIMERLANDAWKGVVEH